MLRHPCVSAGRNFPSVLLRVRFFALPRPVNQRCSDSDEGAQSGDRLSDDQRVHFPGALVGLCFAYLDSSFLNTIGVVKIPRGENRTSKVAF